jgi:hypothetical protein
MRERLDLISPSGVRKVFKKVFAQSQRGKLLETFKYINNSYLLSIDGTGFFASTKIHCDNCCVKEHNKCHLKIVDFYLDDGELKKNTYFLIENQLKYYKRRLLFVNADKWVAKRWRKAPDFRHGDISH